MAIFEREENISSEYFKNDNSIFYKIEDKIKNQTYNESSRNGNRIKDLNYLRQDSFSTSLFYEIKDTSQVFIPLFNYFDYKTNWLKVNITETIKLIHVGSLIL